jgi:hypothetical protein
MNASCGSGTAWVTLFAGLLTPVIGIVVAFVAWQQWKTARDKLKLDMFDRRLAIFIAVRDYMTAVLNRSDGQGKDFCVPSSDRTCSVSF